MEYGIQLYSVRDLAKENFEQAVAKMAELGYKKMEPAGFFGLSADEVNAIMKKYDVEIGSTHSSLDDLINNYEETVAFHKAIGNKVYIIPGYSLKNQEKIDYFIEHANELCDKLAAEGITLAFHNHHTEFFPNKDGGQPFDQLLYRTKLKFQIDTYWAYVGMKDPVALLNRIEDRLIGLHIKDGDAEGNGFPLGMGTAPVADCVAWGKAHGLPIDRKSVV